MRSCTRTGDVRVVVYIYPDPLNVMSPDPFPFCGWGLGLSREWEGSGDETNALSGGWGLAVMRWGLVALSESPKVEKRRAPPLCLATEGLEKGPMKDYCLIIFPILLATSTKGIVKLIVN